MKREKKKAVTVSEKSREILTERSGRGDQPKTLPEGMPLKRVGEVFSEGVSAGRVERPFSEGMPLGRVGEVFSEGVSAGRERGALTEGMPLGREGDETTVTLTEELLLEEIRVILKDYFVATIRKAGDELRMRFAGGETFCLTVWRQTSQKRRG